MARRTILAFIVTFIFILPLSGDIGKATDTEPVGGFQEETTLKATGPAVQGVKAITEETPEEPSTPPKAVVQEPQATQEKPGSIVNDYSTPEAILARYKTQAFSMPDVIDTRLPDVCMNLDYAIFKKEVGAIVKKAEKASGIHTTYGIFIMDPASGYHYGLNENLCRTDPSDLATEGYFNSASVIKLFQGYILCDMMRQGELDANKTYYDAVTGRKFKLPAMIKTMISRSDNNYSNASLRLVGNKKSNEVLERLGIYDSKLYGEMSDAVGYSRKNNVEKYGTDKRCARLTPRDAGLILYNVYMNRETDFYMKTMNEALLANIYNTRIPVGVAKVSGRYAVAHKTGTNSELGVYNDAGIIYCRRPFILVVFTQSATMASGQGFIRDLAESLTGYFDGKP